MSKKPEVEALYSQARNAMAHSQVNQARRLAIQALSLDPNFLPPWHLLADTFSTQGRKLEAKETLKKALTAFHNNRPAQSALQIHLATLLLKEGELAEAASSIDLAALQGLNDWRTLSRAGYIFMLCEEHRLALSAFSSALSINGKDPELLFNTAAAYRSMGDLNMAEALYDKAISASERNYPAYKLRSDLRKQTHDNNHIDELTNLAKNAQLPDDAKVHVYYALAKELEDLGQYQDSFSTLIKGATLRRKSINYNIENDLRSLEAISTTYNQSTIAKKKIDNDLGKGIIFILGMPRTGSTLVDRILSSIEEVESAGEPSTFAKLLYTTSAKVIGKPLNKHSNVAELIKAAPNINFSEIGVEYERNLLSRAKQKGVKYIIDKNPSNFLYIGAIHLALPKAKIIHVVRDPMDSCYAIYKTLFNNAHPYSYDLSEIGKYYCAYRKLMAHWSATLVDVYHEIQYETLIGNQKKESKKLFDYCDFKWSDKYLNFHKNKISGTATASAAQVRQPIYSDSIEKWKKYQEQLKPLQEIIKKGLE